MGVQEISGHDWHNSSINSHVYWIVLWLFLLSFRHLAPYTWLFVHHFPILFVSLSVSPSLRFFLSSENLFLFLSIFSSIGRPRSFSSPSRGPSATALSLSSPVSPLCRAYRFPRPFTSVVNPELVTSYRREDSQAAAFNKAAARASLIGAARRVFSWMHERFVDKRVKDVTCRDTNLLRNNTQ